MSKKKTFDRLNVIDIESSCWEKPEDIPSGEQSEIIEIGVAVLNLQTLKIEDKESIIVRPTKSKISEFCFNLTGITQKMVDGGITLQEAMEILERKYWFKKRTYASWGDYDRKMFISDCADKGIVFPGIDRSHINIKNIMCVEWGQFKENSLATALAQEEIVFEGRPHCGADDAFNTAKLYAKHIESFRWTKRYVKNLVG